MAIITSVKYKGPTNHRGSRWVATMSDNRGGKLTSTVPFCYSSEDEGRGQAVEAVLAKWVAASLGDVSFMMTEVGVDHRGDYIYRCVSV